jgi:hypothetical protein
MLAGHAMAKAIAPAAACVIRTNQETCQREQAGFLRQKSGQASCLPEKPAAHREICLKIRQDDPQ